MLHIQLLGGFRLVLDGQLITTLTSSRLQSLLGYLILNRHTPQSRQRIAFQFWPDSSEQQALSNLRSLLTRFRKALPDAGHYVYSDVDTLQWRPKVLVMVDVAVFEDGLVQAETVDKIEERSRIIQILDIVVHSYDGELLPGVYEDWIIPIRQRLHNQYLYAAEWLIGILKESGHCAQAIPVAQRLIETDPLWERAYRHLINLHRLNGDDTSALRVYQTCREILQRELNVEPSNSTQRLYMQLIQRTDQVLADINQHHEAASSLVGRAQEWQQLVNCWKRAIEGYSLWVLIKGEAGIGKTYLAEAFIDWCKRQGATIVHAQCHTDSQSIPLAPLIDMVQSETIQRLLPTLGGVWLSELLRLFPELAALESDTSPIVGLAESWQRRRLFEAVTRVVLRLREPVVLFLDSLQWCDQETVDLVHYLMRRITEHQILFVCTVRSDQTVAVHPFARSQSSPGQRPAQVQLTLDRLEIGETATLAQKFVDWDLQPEFVAYLYQETLGNPLFIVEMMRAVKILGPESQSPLQDRGVLTANMKTIIERRLLRQPTQTRKLLMLAALIGREFTFDVLLEALGQESLALLDELDHLCQREILREVHAGVYAFNHETTRKVAQSMAGATRQRLFHRQIAQAIEAVHSHALDAVSAQIAFHYERADAIDQAIVYYQRAAQTAQREHVDNRAAQYLQQVLNLIQLLPISTTRVQIEKQIHLSLARLKTIS